MLLLRCNILPRPLARSLATAARHTSFTPLLINGERRAASDGRTFEVRNPAKNQLVGTAASATASDCVAAIEAASAAHPEWEATPVTTRAAILLKVAAELEECKSTIVETLHRETATTPAWAEGNLMGALHTLRTAAGMSSELIGRAYPSALAPGGQVIEQKRALGVVFSIAPWNAPIVLSVRAIAIPLLCGNSVVFKGSEYSPASQSIITDAFVKAGAPPGTINFLSTSAQDAPARCAEIIAHPSVRKLTFTGSDTVGRALAIECAKHLKPAVLELGGKSAAVVLADADIEHAAQTIVFGALSHSGQVCMSTERVIVERSVAGKLRDAIKALVERVPIAPEEGEGVPVKQIAPLFKEQAAENVIKAIKEAQGQGAKVLVGNAKRQGSSIRPHLITDVPLGSTLWKRETFGPVISFVEADNVKHAIELANSSDYTLTASLFTQNVTAALQVASSIRAGATIVNGPTFHPEPTNTEIGLGGSSGYGRFDVDGFTDRRTIVIYPTPFQ